MANPKIIGSITLAALLVSAFLAFKNKNAYQNEIYEAANKKDQLEANRDSLKEQQDISNEVDTETRETEQAIASLGKEDDRLKSENYELKAQEKEKADQVDRFQGASDSLDEQEARFAKVRDVVDKLRRLSDDIKTLDESIAEGEAAFKTLDAENAEIEKDVTALREVLESRSQGRSLEGMMTTIRAIYPSWGFVTLEDGDTAGVVLNSMLNVMRNGEVIGKLLVSAVEKDSASASIVPDSIQAGNVLMVGDQVVPAQLEEVAQN